ncbi:MAG: hypothetical protein ACRBCJ_11960 [Hyphomicrobiaceae bacterium]
MPVKQNVYKEIMQSRVLGVLETARAAGGLSHSGLKGRAREILAADHFFDHSFQLT